MIKLIKSTFWNEKSTKEKLTEFILNATQLSMGPECEKLEKAFSMKQQRKWSLFVSSGSAANLILIQALLNLGRLRKGNVVAVSALTWATNVMPLMQLGLIPTIVDCEMESLNVSKINLEKAGSEGLSAVFLTNVLGFCADIENIKDYCEEKSIVLLEDNCESLGSVAFGKLLGNFGLASTFSTFVGHHFSTIEGGFVSTDDEELYDTLVMTRAHGWDRNLSSEKQEKQRKRHGIDNFQAKYTFYDLAYNVRPNEITGFLGNEQLRYWDDIVDKRAKNFLRFHECVLKNSDFIPMELTHMTKISNFAMPIIARNEVESMKYKTRCERNEVEIRPVIAGNIVKQPFWKKYGLPNKDCPNADHIHENGFYFANNPELSEEDIQTLCSILIK